MKTSALQPKNELLDVFVQFQQKWVTALRKQAKSLPLTLSQIEALRFVIEEKNPTMKDVAEHLHITAPSATAMIEQLSDKKLVQRKTVSSDRRTVRICPTAKASKLRASLVEIKAQIFEEMLKNLGSEDKKIFTAILKKLI